MWLSTQKLQGVVAYAPEDLYVTVRAGTRLADLQVRLTADGLWAPLISPWSESTVGGIVSTNLNGPQRMRYGAVRDLVLGVRVVLPDGRCLRFGRPVMKNVAGYDMTKLFIGAYGTLGLITEVTLRLAPLPRTRRSLLIPVDDLASGLSLSQSLRGLSLVASGILLFAGGARPPGVSPSPYLLVFTAEGHLQDISAELSAVWAELKSAAINDVFETDSLAGTDLWAELLSCTSSYARIGLPPKEMPAYIEANASTLIGKEAGTTPYVADFASGLIYLPLTRMDRLSRLRQSAVALGGYAVVMPPCRRAGTAQGSSLIDVWGYTPETLPLMRRLKACWDPAGCLNPGLFLM